VNILVNNLKVSSGLSISTPSIFRVNKQVSAEVSGLISHLNDLRTTYISGGEFIESTGQAFSTFITHSRFVIQVDPRATLHFLGSLSLDTCSAIRSLVLADELLSSSSLSPGCIDFLDWSRPDQLGEISPEEHLTFRNYLRSYLPNLNEVALFVPTTLEREAWSMTPAH
jgi:hypothetical protein